MPPASVYHPVWFYLITIGIALLLCPLLVFLGHEKKKGQLQAFLFLLGLCVPCITSLIMIYSSHNEILREDFWMRLFLFKISFPYLLVILFLMPCIVCLATGISLFFGYTTEQFSISKEFSVMKGWSLLGIALPLVLAPLLEELGWRGYGVDSLRVYCTVFTTSVLFGLLWAVWHLPAFFIKGYYHNQLWHLGILYVVNFFVSVFVVAFLMNWVYFKTDRSIPAVVLFHSILNLFSMLFKTAPFTKCIVTVLLFAISLIVIMYDSDFFFGSSILWS